MIKISKMALARLMIVAAPPVAATYDKAPRKGSFIYLSPATALQF
jgi:hypothetical protein